MTNLKNLQIPCSKTSKEGITQIGKSLTRLEYLDISGSKPGQGEPLGYRLYAPEIAPLNVASLRPLFALTRLECLKLDPVLVRQFWDSHEKFFIAKKKFTQPTLLGFFTPPK